MPPLIIAVLANYIAAQIAATMIAKMIIAMIINFVLTAIYTAMTAKGGGGGGGGSPFQAQATERVRQLRQPITSRRIIYGEVRTSGPMVFVSSTETNKFLHVVICLAGHECQEIGTVQLNDDPIFVDQIDSNGDVNDGKYSGKVRIKKHLGAADQLVDSDLEGINGWTSSHRLRGVCYIYLRLEFDQDLFPTSIPSISAFVKGKKVEDWRNAASPTETIWSQNPAMCIRDYLLTSRVNGGPGATSIEIDDALAQAAANVCDEMVTTTSLSETISSIDAGSPPELITFASTDPLKFQTGDRVQMTTTGTLPAGVVAVTNYFVIVDKYRDTPAIKLATTYDNALRQIAMSLGDSGSGTHTVTKNAEPRYTMNGTIDVSESPKKIIGELLTAMGGMVSYVGGVWKIKAAAYTAPTISLSEDDFDGSITVSTKHSRRERFNRVKGVYVSPLNFGQPSDFPPVTNATYVANDNGEEMWRDIDLPYTSRAHTAQRIAKIMLEEHRQQISAQLPCNLNAMQLQAGDTVKLSIDRFGWVDKIFEVKNWKLAIRDSGPDADPRIGIDLMVGETASASFDWNNGEETLVDPAPDTTLPDALTVGAPTALSVATQFFSDIVGAQFHSIIVTWAAPTDQYVANNGWIEIQFKKSIDTSWEPSIIVDGEQTIARINQIEDAVNYDIRARAKNHLGVRSNFNTITNYLVGSSVSGADSITDYGFVAQGATVTLDRHEPQLGSPEEWLFEVVDSNDFYDWGTLV